MGKRISHAADLPDWFETSKYGTAITLDARGWCEQLTVREECLDMVGYFESPDELSDSEFYGFKPVQFLSAVRASPIFSYYGSQFEQTEEHPVRNKSAYPPGIYGISASDIGNIILAWEPKRQEEFLRWLEFKRVRTSLVKPIRRPRRRIAPWLYKPLEGECVKPVSVAATFPDDVLSQSFQLYLSQLREKWPSDWIDKPKRLNTFLEWSNCGLLQYLDLKIWSIQKNTNITNKALARGIFPNNWEKGEENIRTTTKKHAAIILDQSTKGLTMSTIWAYARLEDFLESQESK